VKARYEQVAGELSGHFVISLIIRTGWPERRVHEENVKRYMARKHPDRNIEDLEEVEKSAIYRKAGAQRVEFLHYGDDLRFQECLRSAAGNLDPSITSVRVFVTSDSQKVIDGFTERFASELEPFLKDAHGQIGGKSQWKLVLNDFAEPTHVDANSDEVTDSGIIKAYSDYFLIGQSDVTFQTANSLFGDAAAQRKCSYRRYHIDGSKCSNTPRAVYARCIKDSEHDDSNLQCAAKLKEVVDKAYNPLGFGQTQTQQEL
jgi:hypothetical protein